MSTSVESKITLTFKGNLNKSFNINIPHVDVDIDDSVVKNCMDALKDADIFYTSAGTMVGLDSAKLTTTTTETLA